MQSWTVKTGFTLAEVLIALVLLGVVAALAVPKVLAIMEEKHKKAVFRETVGLISEALSESYLDNSFTGNAAPILNEKLNVLRADPKVASPNTCAGDYGYILKNGARLVYRDCSNLEEFYVNYDGLEKGQNQLFSDTLIFWANMGKTTCCCGIKPGAVGVVSPQVCPGEDPPWSTAWNTTQEYYDFYKAMVVD